MKIRQYFNNHPLRSILMLAFIVRLLAVFFAKGYMMHDDHFLTVEPAGSWAAGNNFNNWLPGIGNDRPVPEPISFFYPGILFVIFKILHWIGVDSPDTQMYFVRFIHACYSLLIVYFGYRITELLSNQKNAIRVGLLLAFIAVLPNFSVRNLVEIVCIPPLMAGVWILINRRDAMPGVSGIHRDAKHRVSTAVPGDAKHRVSTDAIPGDAKHRVSTVITASILLGLAVGIRYQTVLIVGGIGLVLLFQKQFKHAVLLGIISFVTFFLTQIDDVLLWGGKPFQHLFGYFNYNSEHANAYPGSPLAYFSFILIFLLPPVSFFLLSGFIYHWKKYLLITLPVTIFILFHIFYPNRQERFILPALPFVVVIGVIGWNALIDNSGFWKKNKVLHRVSWNLFWTINIIAMTVLCFTYSKKSRVEAMVYLQQQPDFKNFIQDFSYSEGGALVPQFYTGKWTGYYTFRRSTNFDHDIPLFPEYEKNYSDRLTPRPQPNYILFFNDDELDMRVSRLKKFFPSLEYRTTIEPGWFDKMLNRMNEKNSIEKVHIYRIGTQ